MYLLSREAVSRVLVVMLILSAALLAGCANKNEPSPANPVTLTLWHNFGGQMQTTMDELVDEFNNTLGKEKGIILNVTSISDSATIRDKLTAIAADDPGAPEMPDIATCYPQTATLLAAKGLLAPLDRYFSPQELEAYLPRFLDEGRLGGELYVFPFAKSTEVLFVNKTLFNEFSAASGVDLQQLATFEGIADAALKYYNWTDSLTPEVGGDGKNFYTADSLFNLAQVGMEQLGRSLLVHGELALDNPEFQRIWSFSYEPAVKGGYALYYGYSSDLAKTGEIVCSTGSTAGILFYGTSITYPDNTSREVEYVVLPYPTFQGGEKIAIQRGSGLVVAKSTPAKEKAASIFLKWFTAPKQNLKFVATTGYLPVTHAAFGDCIAEEISSTANENIKKLLETAITVHREYDFYIPPIFESYDAIAKEYETAIKQKTGEARARYLALLDITSAAMAYQEASRGVYEGFIVGK